MGEGKSQGQDNRIIGPWGREGGAKVSRVIN